jgi:RimJ/RimL family protein N-acetyltransferase
MKLGYLKKQELEKIDSLLANCCEFSSYRNYRVFSKDQIMKYFFANISNSLDRGDYIVVAKKKDKIIGLASLHKLIWDTHHFGLEMAKIGYLIAEGLYQDSIIIKNELLSSLLQICKKKGIRHLSCKIDTSDFSTIRCLEAKGFMLMDALATYVFVYNRHSIPKLKDLYRVRRFKKNDLNSLLTLVKENFWINRFHIDPYIPKNKALQLHIEWIKNCCNGKLADKVLVAERSGNVIGFFTYKLDEILRDSTGIKCWGRGIAAISPQAKGAYVSLLKAAVQRGKLRAKVDLGEFETQIWNYPVIKIYKRFGMDYVSSKYSYHKWLGKPNN